MASIKNSIDHIKQENSGECLIVCVSMVLRYYGHNIRHRRLERTLGLLPGYGTPSSRVKQLQKLGFDVIYERGDFDRLRQHLQDDRPCIVFVNTKELPYRTDATSHAVVVIRIDESVVYLHDPDMPTAPYEVPIADFDLAWLHQREMYGVILRKT